MGSHAAGPLPSAASDRIAHEGRAQTRPASFACTSVSAIALGRVGLGAGMSTTSASAPPPPLSPRGHSLTRSGHQWIPSSWRTSRTRTTRRASGPRSLSRHKVRPHPSETARARLTARGTKHSQGAPRGGRRRQAARHHLPPRRDLDDAQRCVRALGRHHGPCCDLVSGRGPGVGNGS